MDIAVLQKYSHVHGYWLLPLIFLFQLCKSSLELYFCFTSYSFSFLSVYTYIIMDNYKVHFTISIAWWNSSDSFTPLPPVINCIMYIACMQFTQVIGWVYRILQISNSFLKFLFFCLGFCLLQLQLRQYFILHIQYCITVVDSSFNIICTFSCSALCLSCFSFSNCSRSTRLSLQQQQVTMMLQLP